MTELTVDELHVRVQDLEMVYKSHQEHLADDAKVIDSLRQKVKALERQVANEKHINDVLSRQYAKKSEEVQHIAAIMPCTVVQPYRELVENVKALVNSHEELRQTAVEAIAERDMWKNYAFDGDCGGGSDGSVLPYPERSMPNRRKTAIERGFEKIEKLQAKLDHANAHNEFLTSSLQATKAKLSIADGVLNWPPAGKAGLTATREQVDEAILKTFREHYWRGAVGTFEEFRRHVSDLLFPPAVPVDDEGVAITGNGFDTVILVDHKEFCRTHSTDNAVEIRNALKAVRKAKK